jgi:hypothetical protein
MAGSWQRWNESNIMVTYFMVPELCVEKVIFKVDVWTTYRKLLFKFESLI